MNKIGYLLKVIILEILNGYTKLLLLFGKASNLRVNKKAECELHIVVRHIDIFIAINSINTFYLHSNLRIPLMIHCDQDVTSADLQILKSHLPFATIISKTEADKLMVKRLRKYKYCQSLRKRWQGIKLLDAPLLAKTKKIIIIDSDMFFLGNLSDIAKWASKPKSMNLFLKDYKHFSELSSAEFKEYLGFKRINYKFNSGILCLNLNNYDLDLIEKTLNVIQDTLYERIRYDDDRWRIEYRHLVEQTAYIALFSVTPSKPLSNKYILYPIVKNNFWNNNFSKFKAIHFTGEFPRYRIYHLILKLRQPRMFKLFKFLNKFLPK